MMVDGDPARLAQVMGNLLQNAAKFTPAGGRASVTLEVESRFVRVRVEDTGMGMCAETLTRLFQPFVQANQTLDRSSGGLGLGLALVKGLVEMHGGTVSARSEGRGRGSVLDLRLPRVTRAAAPVVVEKAGLTRVGRRRILVIEDNAEAAESLRLMLALEGHAIAVAHSGAAGIERARTFRPDVVLCDIGLPGLDGYQVAKALRADGRRRPPVLVALTGYALPEDVERARRVGFDRHLAKPPSVEALWKVLAEGGGRAVRKGGARTGGRARTS
jgi:two-component system CheB/CheR fusion protein